ncbi:ABC transporter permease [Bacillus massilinigeriensis]|uniref:ABC transporter permease n=1 Tax=Bacillus mediterraneensis TaxID=1805474 RepID=UPI0008F8F1F2|nr:ABC transporter permease [Bacillus mediterraneensis]
MFDANVLWKERFSLFMKETGRYLRYIFNGHLVIVFLFLIGTAGFYYQQWVESLSEGFPTPVIMAALLAFVLAYSPIHTFLTEADKIFLLPLEMKLKSYFQKTAIASFFFQIYTIVILLAVLMPMYVQTEKGAYGSYLLFLAAASFMKILNLFARWKVQYFIEPWVLAADSCIRYFVNYVFLFLLFSQASLPIVTVPVVILGVIGLYFHSTARERGLKWEYLIGQDEKRMAAFYRLANLFTDVPQLKDIVKRRRWLDWIFARLPYGQDQVYSHLYSRTFFRTGDYLGLVTRLILIGGMGVYFLTYGPGQIILALLFLYLTAFQLQSLYGHHDHKLWIELYPIPSKQKEKSFAVFFTAILVFQTAAFSAVILLKGQWESALLTVVLGILFSWYFVNYYSKKRRNP